MWCSWFDSKWWHCAVNWTGSAMRDLLSQFGAIMIMDMGMWLYTVGVLVW